MDPNPKKFPILSYVLSRIPSLSRPAAAAYDIEQPPPLSPSSASDGSHLVSQMPNLTDPNLLASMTKAVSDVAQTRSVLRSLGERPDHEAVDNARATMAEIEARLAKRLEAIVLEERPEGVDRLDWREELARKEKDCREAAEKERSVYKTVVQLDEMHEAYQELLREAEERLVKIYEGSSSFSSGGGGGDGGDDEKEIVDEAVVAVLREVEIGKRVVEKVELSGRQLRILPEAFGRLHGLLLLNVSDNLLEVIPDSIAGLERLEELNLSSNQLRSLPDSIGLSLVELDASFNELTFLPTNIGYELVNLQKLVIHLNKIRSLPTSVCEMKSLRQLDAHFNELRGLPHAIGRLTNLESLNLGSNFSDLTELPETFGDLTNLRELDLSNNQIHALPDTFGRLDNLTKLNLDQNPLVLPPPEVVSKGVEAVKVFMAKRWIDILIEEEHKSKIEAEQTQTADELLHIERRERIGWRRDHERERVKEERDREERERAGDRRLAEATELRLTAGIQRRHGRPVADELQQPREAGAVADCGPAGGGGYAEAAPVQQRVTGGIVRSWTAAAACLRWQRLGCEVRRCSGGEEMQRGGAGSGTTTPAAAVARQWCRQRRGFDVGAVNDAMALSDRSDA
ncbi:hypothetical protein Scep_017927 [Stephania cephalantha]|uniref:Uncharacterized protein n=1 Tax=Stephania cephalantha TaxID=152367 RepID=A0AAP0IQC5_9MAGN